MKALLLIAISSLTLLGCHRHGAGEHHHDDQGESEGHSHGADAKSFSGAIHKEGEGITLLPETKERLGIKLDEVRQETLPREISFTVRVFALDNKGEFEATGLLSAENARYLKEGSRVQLQVTGTPPLHGFVARSSTPISTNETEVIVRFSAPKAAVSIGSFVRAATSVPSEQPVTTIPRDALIKGTTETFVYVQNEDAYLRTVVKPGRETADAVEVEEGLLEGDFVVSKGAIDLWLVELRAVKGGQGCCPAPPVKGKGK